jgi:four helix bundle protein
MDVFPITRSFPPEEKYSLTDQVRRSSRSICTNIAEAYRKKKYPAHFVLKISDSDAENSETGVWLDFSKDCWYMSLKMHLKFIDRNEELGRLLNHMINNPDNY